MNAKDIVLQDYYGMLHVLKQSSINKHIVFVIDDDEFYLNFIKQQLAKIENVDVHTFSTGEDALMNTALNPDFVIIDYHLNSKFKSAKNGDIIAFEFNKILPESKILLVTSDKKNKFLNALTDNHSPIKLKIHSKNNYLLRKVKTAIINIIKTKQTLKYREIMFVSVIVLIIGTILLTLKTF